MTVDDRTTRRKSSSSWSSARVLLARGSGREEGAGTSGVIDRCGHCRSSWWDNGPRHFAESRHHELLGRIHGTRLLSWTSRLVGRACAWGTSSQEGKGEEGKGVATGFLYRTRWQPQRMPRGQSQRLGVRACRSFLARCYPGTQVFVVTSARSMKFDTQEPHRLESCHRCLPVWLEWLDGPFCEPK
jgi:hypothetical protein